MDNTQSTPANPLALIDKALTSGISPDQLGKLLDLQERWERSRAAEAFAAAITGFQSECPTVHKRRKTKESDKFEGYHFASYDDVMREAGPILAKYQIAVTFSTEPPQADRPGMVGTCRIRVGTHFEDTTLFLPIPAMKVNDTQKFGAAVSYLKRYLLCAALNIVVTDEDDDASRLNATISGKQIEQINTLIEECEAAGHPVNLDKFKAWLDVEHLNDMPAARFADAVRFLTEKRNGKAKVSR